MSKRHTHLSEGNRYMKTGDVEKNCIKLENISHNFGEKTVLHDINLQVEKGEIIGLLGPSGAGKTTLINIITGQLSPTAGKIYINGEEVNPQKRDLSGIGIMMDDLGLYERLSVYDNLKFYANLYNVGIDKVDHVLEKAGLSAAKKTVVGNLSKGMRNRVNFCRALLKEIEILFLDEPTSGLDPSTMHEIHDMIRAQKEKGTTIFLTTHNMYEAQTLCNHVALLNQGKIVEYGEPEEICKRYNHLNKIEVGRKNGEMVVLDNNKSCLSELTALLEQDDVATIHSTEPDLEKVFLELTGRRFES